MLAVHRSPPIFPWMLLHIVNLLLSAFENEWAKLGSFAVYNRAGSSIEWKCESAHGYQKQSTLCLFLQDRTMN